MKDNRQNISLENWIEKQLSLGRYSFSASELKKFYDNKTENAVLLSLKRLADKRKIFSIYKGYYLIIPPQYSNLGIIPVPLYIDAFMKFLNAEYYLAALSSAVYHGASHQQPQEYFIVTDKKGLKSVVKKDIKINCIYVPVIPAQLLVKLKTEAGYMFISNPALTAVDIIKFEKKIGGLNRAATVLVELAEEIKEGDFNKYLLGYAPVVSLQKLGYLLENVCGKKDLADALFEAMITENVKIFRTPLKSSKKKSGFSSDNRWKIIVNTIIEADE